MRLAAAVFVLCLAVPAVGQDRAPRERFWPADLIELWGRAEDMCRGSYSSDPQQPDFCAIRTDLTRRLRRFGLCYGAADDIAANYRWHWCARGSNGW
ncbi:hypothetical protein EOD42_16865 [Rhodovarius crocodyli]|uniref:YARHG domain-containing protein n=2 Tax=Rhodovarius crocodyli TaxID=1979269 RepID=A0A437MCA8_9PROT|nr:hypothetical protein EOD42_16865 [Rhodovarius crocodyli]